MNRGSKLETPPYRVECRAGRLIEARVFRLQSPEETDAYAAVLASEVAKASSARAVLCADHRPVAVYKQSVADRLAQLFMTMNARLDRVAILVARSNATLLLQLDRLVREAAYSNRKVVHTPEGVIEHLGPILDAAELVRAREFIAEWNG